MTTIDYTHRPLSHVQKLVQPLLGAVVDLEVFACEANCFPPRQQQQERQEEEPKEPQKQQRTSDKNSKEHPINKKTTESSIENKRRRRQRQRIPKNSEAVEEANFLGSQLEITTWPPVVANHRSNKTSCAPQGEEEGYDGYCGHQASG